MRMTWILGAALMMSLGACGGASDPSSPAEACEAKARAVCAKLYECLPVADLIQIGLPPTEAECVTMRIANNACANATAENSCATGETYHLDQVPACLSAYESRLCPEFLLSSGDPPACDAICTTN